MISKKTGRTAIVILLILIMVILWASTQGTANISMLDSLHIIANRIPLINKIISNPTLPDSYYKIVLNVRLPRIILALFVGAGLSISGSVFQGIFKNPMADPFILGVSSGAALGVTISLVFGLNFAFMGFGIHNLMAFGMAMLTVLIVFRIGAIGRQLSNITLLLAGIAINYFVSAIITLMMILNREHLERIYLWTLGSLSTASWKDIFLVAPVVIVGSIILLIYAKDLNLLLLGENNAKSLGIEVHKVKKLVLIVSSFMISIIVAVSGIIGFVGLIMPHITRFMVGPDHKRLLPLAWLNGAIFMIICDTMARSLLPPREISVGIITSLFGVPFFIYLLYQHKKKVL